ncbi:hypothetical protein Tco_0291596 [Tanacetum coccineum]
MAKSLASHISSKGKSQFGAIKAGASDADRNLRSKPRNHRENNINAFASANARTDNQEKDEKQSQNDKTRHGMEKL